MNLEITRGDTGRQYQVAVMIDGAPADLTGLLGLDFVAASNSPPLRIVSSLGSGVTVNVDPTTGLAIISNLGALTAPFPNRPISMRWNWVLTDAAGNETTTESGVFEVLARV